MLRYQATGRERLDHAVHRAQPRGAVGYGSDTLLAYVEGYGFGGPTTVPFKVFDEQENRSSRLAGFRAGREVESQVIRLAPDSVSLGELRLVMGVEPDEKSRVGLVSFTKAWVVTNFDEMLDLLRYFGPGGRGPPAARRPTSAPGSGASS